MPTRTTRLLLSKPGSPPYEETREMDVELALGLRETGYGVWQA